jgi:hypothetical protein
MDPAVQKLTEVKASPDLGQAGAVRRECRGIGPFMDIFDTVPSDIDCLPRLRCGGPNSQSIRLEDRSPSPVSKGHDVGAR